MKKLLSPEYFYEIRSLLKESLGEPEILHQVSPLAWCESALEVLLATILTQATSDRNALKAWLNFKKVYSSPQNLLKKPREILYETIRPAGMYHERGETFIHILNEVYQTFGEYSLDCLKKDPQAAWKFLNSLAGVGPKTSACTMLFGLGLPYFPVDVHIDRIAKRQGWVDSKAVPGEIQTKLGRLIPGELMSDLHILLLNLGRKYCRPKNPDCSQCPLNLQCTFANRISNKDW